MKESYQSGFVTLIGRPNVGKSTLMNQIIGQKIAITSYKPQTTRNRIQTIYTTKRGQIIFVDTPGMHQAKTKLGEYMVSATKSAWQGVDLILWLIEPTAFVHRVDEQLAEQLKSVSAPVILVINKIDTVKKEELLKTIDVYQHLYSFVEMIPISAKNGENKADLIDGIFKYLPEGPQLYDADMITDQPERQIASEFIREKLLYFLQEEVPHGVAVLIDQMRQEERKREIHATIVCEKDSHKGMIIGKQGKMLKQIGIAAREQLEDFFGQKVDLRLWVKVKKNWKDSDFLLKNYGYAKKDLF